MKVLIVDDSKFVRKMIRKCFKNLPVELEEAEDGKQALEAFREKGGFDLVVTDWNMPRMDGLELVKNLVEEQNEKQTKIVMVTTENDQFNIIRALEAGCDDFLMKPFRTDELLDRLKAIWGQETDVFSQI